MCQIANICKHFTAPEHFSVHRDSKMLVKIGHSLWFPICIHFLTGRLNGLWRWSTKIIKITKTTQLFFENHWLLTWSKAKGEVRPLKQLLGTKEVGIKGCYLIVKKNYWKQHNQFWKDNASFFCLFLFRYFFLDMQ